MAVSEFQMFVISGLLLMLVPIMAIAYFQAGFFWKWARVKGSRGRKILVKSRSPLRDNFWVGEIIEGMLVFKDSTKEEKRISPNGGALNNCVYNAMGIKMIDVDEEKNCMVLHNFDAVSGFDAIKWGDLLKRALYKPALEDKTMIIILVLVIVMMLILLGNVFFSFKTYQMVQALSAAKEAAVASTAGAL